MTCPACGKATSQTRLCKKCKDKEISRVKVAIQEVSDQYLHEGTDTVHFELDDLIAELRALEEEG